jgi:hypothetical protein
VIRCDEHMSKLLIFSDEELEMALRARQLLEAGPPGCARPGRAGDHHPSSAGSAMA